MSRVRVRVKKPSIAYPGSFIQQNYAEAPKHGYFLWKIISATDYDVSFQEIRNKRPYVTIDWLGDAKTVLQEAEHHPSASRFRVRSKTNLTQKEIEYVSSLLTQKCQASEVVFKSDTSQVKDAITAGGSTIVRSDLRSIDVLQKMLLDYAQAGGEAMDDEMLVSVRNNLIKYASVLSADDVARNTKWSLKEIKFENMFSYGENNVINFDKLNGIIGVFGQNRIGKSSIVGTILYSLFNTTDRGSVKNLHVVNERKDFCSSRVLFNAAGRDYIIERQTTKHENKRGQINAATALNLFKIENGDAVDLVGEQRTDTEKSLKTTIGTVEDFLMTSVATQGDINQFISHGSTKRSQTLSRFLDLDIFGKMHDQANKDGNVIRAQLKNYPDFDHKEEILNKERSLSQLCEDIKNKEHLHDLKSSKLSNLLSTQSRHTNTTIVTQTDIDAQQTKLNRTLSQRDELQEEIDNLEQRVSDAECDVKKIDQIKTNFNIEDLRLRMDAFKSLETSVMSLKHVNEKELASLGVQEKSLKILEEVPCGDKFPSCKFIKDAHTNKLTVHDQRDRAKRAKTDLDGAIVSLEKLKSENVASTLKKVEQLYEKQNQLRVKIANNNSDVTRLSGRIETLEKLIETERASLSSLQMAQEQNENVELVQLKQDVAKLTIEIKGIDRERLDLVREQGRVSSDIDKLVEQSAKKDALHKELNVCDLITRAFSKKGIPSNVIRTQLPIINEEIARILHGIVDFSIELENDETSDTIEIYMNYGDSRRLIELGSGMEKTMCSLAVRTALINVSSLPKTDIFILDEAFNALDEAGIEACNRLLVSLKKYFKTIIIITHLDGIKDVVDDTIEITKNGKFASVVYGD